VKMLRNDVKKQTEDSSVYVRWDEVAVRLEKQKLGIACGFASYFGVRCFDYIESTLRIAVGTRGRLARFV
jgi:hypothetical protein